MTTSLIRYRNACAAGCWKVSGGQLVLPGTDAERLALAVKLRRLKPEAAQRRAAR